MTSDIIKCRDQHRRIHPKDVILSLRKEYVEGGPDVFDGYLLVSTKDSDSGPSTTPTDIPLYLKPSKGEEVSSLQNLKVKKNFFLYFK